MRGAIVRFDDDDDGDDDDDDCCPPIHRYAVFENTYFMFFFQISKKHDFLRFF